MASCSMGQLLGMTEWIFPPPACERPRSEGADTLA